jgi:hypothetical protein
LAFSYWIDYLGFITEGKLAAIFIKPSLGVSNWSAIYYTFPHQLGTRSFLSPLPGIEEEEAPTSSSPRHQRQQVFWHHHHRAINKFSGAVAGEKEDFCKGSFARTSFTLF